MTRLSMAFFLMLVAQSAHACPFCHSETGRLVWSGIFNEHFLLNVITLSAPFFIFAAIAAFVHSGPWLIFPPFSGFISSRKRAHHE